MEQRKKMTSVDATYDGKTVITDEPLPLPADTRVTVSFETADEEQPQAEATEEKGEPYSFLKAVRAANLQGPPDWSERIGKPPSFIDTALLLSGEGLSDWSQRVDHYLYGEMVDDGEG